ncbi:Holliday junction branch migration protein RuvA [Thermomicrobiaceae bacterium CFH 74404]|uniref:Holliday junction branch migration complex subunit RuvA n=1 Tax=Thermalbibacter longus TaxID=2951981 RepID=A0AA42BA86_9BACT|nr:Holliday junction branch migration protein RuvA [Thermalbibacter longus]MCM8748244.1 Holliday junction branch migration protein RuvA [Thermalbibacter longus]
MIRGVRGRLVAKQPGAVLVDLHGFILRLYTSQTTLADLGQPGEEVELVTHLRVREDELALYGFASAAELELFELLIGVSGVGPRAALALLSIARPDELSQIIAAEDVDRLSRAPGIGRKTASRIVLELRGKLPALAPSGERAEMAPDREVVEALMALGYSATEAREAASRVSPAEAPTLEERVLAALRLLARTG